MLFKSKTAISMIPNSSCHLVVKILTKSKYNKITHLQDRDSSATSQFKKEESIWQQQTSCSTFGLFYKGQKERSGLHQIQKLAFIKMISTRTLGLSFSLVILVGFTVFLCSQSLIKFLDYPTFMGSAFEDQRTGNFPDLTFCLHSSLSTSSSDSEAGMNQVCTTSSNLINFFSTKQFILSHHCNNTDIHKNHSFQ